MRPHPNLQGHDGENSVTAAFCTFNEAANIYIYVKIRNLRSGLGNKQLLCAPAKSFYLGTVQLCFVPGDEAKTSCSSHAEVGVTETQ